MFLKRLMPGVMIAIPVINITIVSLMLTNDIARKHYKRK